MNATHAAGSALPRRSFSMQTSRPGRAGAGQASVHAIDSARARATQAARREFESLCLPHRNELYGMAMHLTRQAADANDLVQETLLRAYQAWPTFERGSNCRAWLFRILMNSYINVYRKRKRHSQFAIVRRQDTVRAVYGEAKDHADDPATAIMERELGDEVSTALASLGDEQREVVEMADLQGERYRDIATRLGLPLGTVMSRLHRARRQLEKQLSHFAATQYGICRAA